MQSDSKPKAESKAITWLQQEQPLVIAGPCSAESREQVLETARALALDGRTHYFRAGIWKPRTSPGSFQGVGVEGLQWLKEVKAETGLRVTTEVGNEMHVEEALKAGIDMLWIGARTVSNPFVIQQIADALRGVDVHVLVKNPLSPDIDLWEGAIKRLAMSGVKELGAIHRGFSWYGKSQFRNQPLWHIPIELKKRMPQVPMIGDPSHMGGKRGLIGLLASRALEHHFDGMMIEVHPNPDMAWSDAAQQITPKSFVQIMNNVLGSGQIQDPMALLDELRNEIDTMDDMLIWALSSRMELASKIAGLKGEMKMPVVQNKRWEELMARVKNLGELQGLRPVFTEHIFNSIHDESVALQKNLLKSNETKKEKETNFAL